MTKNNRLTNKIGNEAVVLSPSKRCRKTGRIIAYLEQFAKKEGYFLSITVESDLKKILKYRTWILPTIVINGKIVARGYKPGRKKLLSVLKR